MSRAPESASMVVPPTLDGERLDRAVPELFPTVLSRSQIARRIRDGCLSINGEVIRKPGFPVTAGQILELREPAEPDWDEEGLAAPRIVYEDAWIVVLDKPAGLPMHGNYLGDRRPSVATFLSRRYGPHLPAAQGAERPGIVHRLDRETSGVCVAALEAGAFEDLQEQFFERAVSKVYDAVCYGTPRFQSDWIEKRLARDPRHPERMRVTNSTGPESRDAATFWQVQQRFHGFAWLRVQPKTGRMHQIRVHLAAVDLPVVGDPFYRARNYGPGMIPAGHPPIQRTMLHARALSFEHPERGERVEFTVEPPPDMADFTAFLAVHAPQRE